MADNVHMQKHTSIISLHRNFSGVDQKGRLNRTLLTYFTAEANV